MLSLSCFVNRFIRRWRSKDACCEKNWKSGTIIHPYLGEWGRSLEEYEAKLFFDRSDLQNKTILDLGAGPGLRLCEEVQACGIGARVVSLSPDFSLSEHRTRALFHAPGNEMVAGLGQALPFRDESFDYIFCFFVIEHILPNCGFYFDCMTESARVLRRGGRASFGPCYVVPNEWNGYKTILNHSATMKKLRRYGAALSRAVVPESIIPRQKILDSHGKEHRVLAYNLVIRKT